MKLHSLLIVSLLVCLCCSSCMRSNVYEKNIGLPSSKWNEKFEPSFVFDITDTLFTYHIFLTMRHTDAYPYSNIWLNVKTTKPGEKKYTLGKIEIPLAQADGKWIGRGMNEIWEHKAPLSPGGEPLHFSSKGQYKIQLQQIMRVNPLPEVMSVGIRLEKNK